MDNIVKLGDYFSIDNDNKTYKLIHKKESELYAIAYDGFKCKIAKLDLSQTKKIKLLKKEELKNKILYDKEDYPEFLKDFPITSEKEEALTVYAMDLYRIIKNVLDLFGPFVYIFVKHPKLQKAYELLIEVARERNVIAKSQFATENDNIMIDDIEAELLRTNKNIKNLSYNEILNYVKSLRGGKDE